MNNTKGWILAVLAAASFNASAAKDLMMQLNCNGMNVVYSRTAAGKNMIIANDDMFDTTEGTRVVKAKDGSDMTYQFASRESNGKSLYAAVAFTKKMLNHNEVAFTLETGSEKPTYICKIVNSQVFQD